MTYLERQSDFADNKSRMKPEAYLELVKHPRQSIFAKIVNDFLAPISRWLFLQQNAIVDCFNFGQFVDLGKVYTILSPKPIEAKWETRSAKDLESQQPGSQIIFTSQPT